MAFTGILGTAESRPGNLQPGVAGAPTITRGYSSTTTAAAVSSLGVPTADTSSNSTVATVAASSSTTTGDVLALSTVTAVATSLSTTPGP